jgi:hypothetical protein
MYRETKGQKQVRRILKWVFGAFAIWLVLAGLTKISAKIYTRYREEKKSQLIFNLSYELHKDARFDKVGFDSHITHFPAGIAVTGKVSSLEAGIQLKKIIADSSSVSHWPVIDRVLIVTNVTD